MSRGIIEAQTLRTEQFEFEARTSDPADAQPGEYWFRVDQTSTNPDVIAELRRQDTSGVTTCPIFAASEESNLGTDVTRGPSVVLDDGSVGFIVMATGRGAVGSPRAVNSAGTQYVSHNALELSPIPDSAISRWEYEDDSDTSTAIDSWPSGYDGNINGATYTTDAEVGSLGLDFGSEDTVDCPQTNDLDGSAMSISTWFKTSDGSSSMCLIGSHGSNGYLHELSSGGFQAFYYDENDTRAEISTAAGSYNTDTYVHYVSTCSADGTVTIYKNGSEVTSESHSSFFGVNNTDPTIHGARPGGKNDYVGRIDDPRLFSKELSATEVDNLYNTGSISG